MSDTNDYTLLVKHSRLLELEHKAELFDFLATHVSEMKLISDFGGCDWVYNDKRTVEEFTTLVVNELDGELVDDEDEDNE